MTARDPYSSLLWWSSSFPMYLRDAPIGGLPRQVRSLREPVMMVHHIGMACMSAAGYLGIYTYYGTNIYPQRSRDLVRT